MAGPCLCGDPYCSSCGNPERAEMEEAVEYYFDKALKNLETPDEVKLFYLVGIRAVRLHKQFSENIVREAIHSLTIENNQLKNI